MRTTIIVLAMFMIAAEAPACPDDLLWFGNYAVRASEIKAVKLVWEHNGDMSPGKYPCDGLGFHINIVVDNKWIPIHFVETRGCGDKNYEITYKSAQKWVNKNIKNYQIKAQEKR